MNGSPDGELIFQSGGQNIAGWTEVYVTRGVERMPSDFNIGGTEKFPGELRDIVPLNSPATITIGGHVVLTGFLERISTRLSSVEHQLNYIGRGRCADIADSAALLNNMTRSSTSISGLAKELLAPFAKNHPAGPIKVLTPTGEGNGRFYTFNINLGESPYDIIARVARYEGLLAYEDADGNLVLSRAGTPKHSSGFVEGKNIQSADLSTTMDQRFSVYIPLLMSSDTLSGRNGDTSVATFNAAGQRVTDNAITRYRPRIIVSEQMVFDEPLAHQRALWEATRRAGLSLRVTIICDSWLDSSGLPWTPNMLAPVSMPSAGIDQTDWVITEVTYRRNGHDGTTAQVTLMPPQALTVEPTAINELQARPITPEPGQGSPSGTAPDPTAPNARPRVNVGEDFGL